MPVADGRDAHPYLCSGPAGTLVPTFAGGRAGRPSLPLLRTSRDAGPYLG